CSIGVAMEEGFVDRIRGKGIADACVACCDTKRQEPAGDSLRQCNNIRLMRKLVDCQYRTCATESGENFIGYAYHIFFLGQANHLVKDIWAVHAHSASGLNEGFKNEGGDIAS